MLTKQRQEEIENIKSQLQMLNPEIEFFPQFKFMTRWPQQ